MVHDSPPHAGAIDQRVAVNQDVAESNDLAKIGNPGREGRVETSELTQGLADNLILALHHGAQDDIAIEIREGFARSHVGDGAWRRRAHPRADFWGHASKIGSRERSTFSLK